MRGVHTSMVLPDLWLTGEGPAMTLAVLCQTCK